MSENPHDELSPMPGRSPLKTLFALAWIVLAVIWLFYVAIAGDYNEAGILLLGMLTAIWAIVLFWDTRFRKAKTALCIAAALALVLTGLFSIKVGRYQRTVNAIIARHILVSVGTALEQYQADGRTLPDCNWSCMRTELTVQGYWREIRIPYLGESTTAPFKAIPTKDGWGCRYLYENLGDGHFVLKSSGPDRRFFTGDDLIYRSGDGPRPPLPALPVFLKKKPSNP